jgi:hypothetical protein
MTTYTKQEIMKHGVYNSNTGEPVLNLNAIVPDCTYALFLENLLIKESLGFEAYYDTRFRSILERNSQSKKVCTIFLSEGSVYTKEKEDNYLKICMKSYWREMSFLKVFLPYEIEATIKSACNSNSFLLLATHYSYSYDFFPLHFFGLKGISKSGDGEIFFISDNIFTTPILKIEIVNDTKAFKFDMS